MKRASVILLTVIAAACASRGGLKDNCVPVPQEFLAAGPAYSDCEVNRRAELTKAARIEVPGRTDGATGCFSAYIDVVVDTTGRLIDKTAKVMRTNNRSYADAVMRQLDQVLYQPAEKDGKRVQQLVHYKAAISYVTVTVRAGQAPPSMQASNMAPRC